MARLRPTLTDSTDPATPCMKGGTAYLLIYRAIKDERVLVHGKLHEGSNSCAIGSYFNRHEKTCLPSALIDEVAAINDSVPQQTGVQRRKTVLKWLEWRMSKEGLTP